MPAISAPPLTNSIPWAIFHPLHLSFLVSKMEMINALTELLYEALRTASAQEMLAIIIYKSLYPKFSHFPESIRIDISRIWTIQQVRLGDIRQFAFFHISKTLPKCCPKYCIGYIGQQRYIGVCLHTFVIIHYYQFFKITTIRWKNVAVIFIL